MWTLIIFITPILITQNNFVGREIGVYINRVQCEEDGNQYIITHHVKDNKINFTCVPYRQINGIPI